MGDNDKLHRPPIRKTEHKIECGNGIGILLEKVEGNKESDWMGKEHSKYGG